MIRQAIDKDIDAISQLCALCQSDNVDKRQMQRHIRHLLNQDLVSVSVAELCGLVAGVVVCQVIPQLGLSGHMGRISTIIVDEPFRDMTLGRQLLVAAEQALIARGCDHIEVVPSYHKEDAQSFYMHCGFQLTPERLIKPLAA
ncbi:hypothetical protein BZG13_10855 [Salinivibrio sp. ML323]|uniref:GNAT family N-acetyltransferase n=1 Tax=unclassified Salinivibrio TaxID=2636825 RepID=UPI000984DD3F|nr:MULTISPECIES: GNAT family N-acetyltransferase [unclassified Salinivibrio]OOE57430.1 hypothetical protein BZG13_10855 [Salinivibrio sp. ML323]OOE64993.1 hypothetical protein BZG14_06670 [Salinivibrio sp. IB282]